MEKELYEDDFPTERQDRDSSSFSVKLKKDSINADFKVCFYF